MQNDLFQQVDSGANPTSPLQLFFRKIQGANANRVFVKNHYAHRAVPISESFGAFKADQMQTLLGAISFGKPASYTLCEGSCGKENSHRVYELNRLWMSDECPKNSESRFIGWSLRILREIHPEWILVSYADPNNKHTGAIYRATNWIYTGLSSRERVYYTEDGNVYNTRRHIDTKGFILRTEYQLPKHRYFYFFDKKDIGLLKYPQVPFL